MFQRKPPSIAMIAGSDAFEALRSVAQARSCRQIWAGREIPFRSRTTAICVEQRESAWPRYVGRCERADEFDTFDSTD